MTENADVKWLRTQADEPQWLTSARARRLLAHIDELEAEVKMLREVEAECGRQLDRRPTVHEIAVQMMAALVASDDRCLLLKTLANESYRAAEALVAEGRRRDGL